MARTLRGNILPLAIVMTVSILLGAVTLGMIVLEGLRRSSATDDSMVAYYSADGGIERQLYEVRKNNSTVTALQALTQTYSNNASWNAANGSLFVNQTIKTFASIKNGDFQFIDLYNPDQLFQAAGVGKVTWTWNDGGVSGCQVELAYTPWDTSQPNIIPDQYSIVLGAFGSATQNLDPGHAYRLRFRPKKCDITNLQVQVYPTSGSVTPMAFSGDITVAAEGAYKKSKQAIAVTMPRLDILNNVFSYVIFSECTLFKDPTQADPICP
ncbi:MAG: hypothetical protein WC477_00645 [Patescibacteria group bacterium]